MTVTEETVSELRRLADGDSYAAFKSAAVACGMTSEEAELVWQESRGHEEDLVLDVRDCGAELRSEDGWLTSTTSVELEEWL